MKEAKQCIPITQPTTLLAALIKLDEVPQPTQKRAETAGPGGCPPPSGTSAGPSPALPHPGALWSGCGDNLGNAVWAPQQLSEAGLRRPSCDSPSCCISVALVPDLLPHGACVASTSMDAPCGGVHLYLTPGGHQGETGHRGGQEAKPQPLPQGDAPAERHPPHLRASH